MLIKKLAEASLFKTTKALFPQGNSLPLEHQWMSQAIDFIAAFSA
jgi:hypothetical protein